MAGEAVLGGFLTAPARPIGVSAVVDDRRRMDVTVDGEWRRGDAKEWRTFVDQAPRGNRPENARHGLAVGMHGVASSDWLEIAKLTGGAFGLAALHFIDDAPRVRAADWQWPLDLALFPDSLGARTWLRKLHWYSFMTVVEAVHATSPIEVLLEPGSIAYAMTAAESVHGMPRVQTAIVLGGVADVEQARAYRRRVRADALCVANVPPKKHQRFVDDLLYHLSHDIDMDVAFTLACKQAKVAAPLIVAAPQGFMRAHASAWTEMVAAHLAPRPDLYATLNGGGPRNGEDIGGTLSGDAEAKGWEHEHDSATLVARAGRAARGASPGRPKRRRYVNAYLCDAQDKKLEEAPLAAGAHYFEVWIGEPEMGALVATSALRLRPQADGHDLSLVFTAPQVLDVPLVEPVHLPPDGASQRVRFDFTIPPDLEHFEARITVLHGNRILQTVKLDAPVGHGAKAKLSLDLECVTRLDMDAAASGRPFDVALLFNQLGGEDSMTLLQNGNASLVELDDIKTFIGNVATILQRVTDDPDSHHALDSKDSEDWLRGLAHHGALLKQRLFQGASTQVDPLKNAKRIQVVSAKPEGLIPLELCYDPPAPQLPQANGKGGAKLCKSWKAALEAGTCGGKCPGDKSTVICPVGFWGLSRVIERRVYKKPKIAPFDFALLPDPTSTRAALNVLDGSICAAAKQARDTDEKGKEVDRAFKTILAKTKGAGEVATWTKWKSSVKKKTQKSSLFVLLPHTETDANLVQTLWIGKNSTGLGNIDETYRGAAGNGALALLLGCSTATVDTFASFASQFQLVAQVPIVVGTLTEILGRHAAPIAEQLVKRLAALPKTADGTPFGDVMTGLRRQMLASGFPIVMALVAFGDADWKV